MGGTLGAAPLWTQTHLTKTDWLRSRVLAPGMNVQWRRDSVGITRNLEHFTTESQISITPEPENYKGFLGRGVPTEMPTGNCSSTRGNPNGQRSARIK